MPAHCRMRAYDRDLIRGGHYGQRPRVPHLKGRTHGCTDQGCKREESSCQLGAVHTWHKADMPFVPFNVRFRGKADHRMVLSQWPLMTQSGHLQASR